MSISMIIAAAAAVMIFGTSSLLHTLLNEERGLTLGKAILSLVFGGIAFATVNFAPTEELKLIITVGVVLLCFVMAYCCYISITKVATAAEVLLNLAVLVFTGGAAFYAVYSMPGSTTTGKIIPVIIGIIGAAIMLVDFFVYHAKGKHLADPEGILPSTKTKYIVCTGLSVVVAVAIIAALLVTAFQAPISASNVPEQTSPKPSTESEKKLKDYVDIIYFNSKLQNDDDKSNDYNFGPSGPTDDVEKTRKEFWFRMKHDPGFAAAQLWREDSKCNTNFLKKFYVACNGDVEDAINTAADKFEKDPSLWEKSVKAYAKWVKNHNAGYEIKTESVWKSQAFMDPHDKTPSGRPRVIAKKTNSGPSHLFVQKRSVNDVIIEVVTRIECGYQPLDVEPDGWTITRPEGGGGNPDPNGPTTPTQPTNPTTPVNPTNPKYHKDPEKAPKKNTEPNDDRGPGPDTNNGPGAQHSTKDQPTNSDHMTLPEYKSEINKIKDINNTQQKAGGPNTPTTPKPAPNTQVDNNGDKGTGYGGADKATPVQTPAKQENGQEITTKPAGQWGGPTG